MMTLMSGTETPTAPSNPFECVIPILRVRSLSASLDYYLDVLGFEIDWHEPEVTLRFGSEPRTDQPFAQWG
jgi:catechol 2,3-dioxygenase-like lactoylglutathione lyase family enzyme